MDLTTSLLKCLQSTKMPSAATPKWIVCNMSNTSASRQSWKRSMISESAFCTKGLKRGRLNRVLTRMPTLFWCRIALETWTIKIERVPRETNTAPTQELMWMDPQLVAETKASSYQVWRMWSEVVTIRLKVLRGKGLSPMTWGRGTTQITTSLMRVALIIVCKSKKKNSTTSSI